MNPIFVWTLLTQVAATLAMVGLIWFVQIVHYPLFSQVGREGFAHYEREHQRLTTYVVAPLMLIELATAVMLFWWRPSAVGDSAVWLGLAILVGIWLTTYIVQLPQHTSLVVAYDATLHQRLVVGNWLRTAAWTARGVLVLWMVGQVLTGVKVPAASESFVRSVLP